MDFRASSNHDLIGLCLAGEQSAWNEFVRRFQEAISRSALKTARHYIAAPDPDLIDDFVSQTYMKVIDHDYRALRNFNCVHENGLYGYLRKIAANIVRDHFRRDPAEWQPLDLDVPDSNPTRKVEKDIFFEQCVKRLRQRLGSEPNRERDLVIFTYYYQSALGLTAKEIAQVLSMETKAVENIILRLKRFLQDDEKQQHQGIRA